MRVLIDTNVIVDFLVIFLRRDNRIINMQRL